MPHDRLDDITRAIVVQTVLGAGILLGQAASPERNETTLHIDLLKNHAKLRWWPFSVNPNLLGGSPARDIIIYDDHAGPKKYFKKFGTMRYKVLENLYIFAS